VPRNKSGRGDDARKHCSLDMGAMIIKLPKICIRTRGRSVLKESTGVVRAATAVRTHGGILLDVRLGQPRLRERLVSVFVVSQTDPA